MRQILPTHDLISCEHTPALHSGSLDRTQGKIHNLKVGNINMISKKTSFSQINRRSVMCENAFLAQDFMDNQHKSINGLIKQLQLFLGYIEQIPTYRSNSCSKHTWSVYLMHAQALHSALHESYKGKSLFGDGVSPPIRVHLEHNGLVEPFDLPDPALICMHSIRSLLAGVADHRLPSADLVNSCLAELMDALVQIQKGREQVSFIMRKLKKEKQMPSLVFTRPSPVRPNFNLGKGWLQKVFRAFCFLIRPFKPVPQFP